jgi:hypothetical protein
MERFYKCRHLTEAKCEITNLQGEKVRKYEERKFENIIEIELLDRLSLFQNKLLRIVSRGPNRVL